MMFDLQLFGGSGASIGKKMNIKSNNKIKKRIPKKHRLSDKQRNDIDFNLKHTNPKFKLGKKYQENCARCTVAYEMRRRGLDVTAAPFKDKKGGKDGQLYQAGFTPSGLVYRHGYLGAFRGAKPINVGGNVKTTVERAQKIMTSFGEGARAIITVRWKDGRGGHAFFAENIKGKVHFIDPQTGDKDVTWYLKEARASRTRITRVDNLKIKPALITPALSRK